MAITIRPKKGFTIHALALFGSEDCKPFISVDLLPDVDLDFEVSPALDLAHTIVDCMANARRAKLALLGSMGRAEARARLADIIETAHRADQALLDCDAPTTQEVTP